MFKDYRNFLALLVSLVLVVISLLYYKERTGLSDTPGYIVHMTVNSGLYIAHNRFIIIGCEWLPWLMLKMGAPLKFLASGYSLAHALFPVLLSAICLFAFRKPHKAIGILLFYILMSRQLFYYPVSEFQMGMVLLLFYDSYLDYVNENAGRQRLFLFFSVILLPTIIFSHPVIILVFAAWLLYRLFKRPRLQKNIAVFITGSAIAIYIVKQIFFKAGYEASKMPDLAGISQYLSDGIYSRPLATSFYDALISQEFMAPLFFLITLIILIINKKIVASLYLILLVLAFFGLILITVGHEYGLYDHYFEHHMQPLVFFTILFFTDNIDSVVRPQLLRVTLLLPFFIIGIVKIVDAHTVIEEKQKWYAAKFRLMDKWGIRKALVLRDELPSDIDKGSVWNATYETMLLSSLEGKEHTRAIFMSWGTAAEQAIREGDENVLLFDGHLAPVSDYPVKYFTLGHERYSVITNDSLSRR